MRARDPRQQTSKTGDLEPVIVGLLQLAGAAYVLEVQRVRVRFLPGLRDHERLHRVYGTLIDSRPFMHGVCQRGVPASKHSQNSKKQAFGNVTEPDRQMAR